MKKVSGRTVPGWETVQEWKREYSNPFVLDGTKWHLEITVSGGQDILIDGSNEYPPMFDSMERMFRYYVTRKVPPETNPEKRTKLLNLFRDDPCIMGIYQRLYGKTLTSTQKGKIE